jgi:hypothetical protein
VLLVLSTLASLNPVRAEDLLVAGGGRERPHASTRVWIRRATLIAGCATSLVFDTLTTRRGSASGAVEANGIFANSQGQPAWGRMIGIKAGVCAFSAVAQETHTFGAWKTPTADYTWTAINGGMTADYTWTSFHNLAVTDRLKTSLQSAPQLPAAVQSASH